MPAFNLSGQIDEVERELRMRQRVYPSFVKSGRMEQSEADFHVERMRAVLETLKFIQKHEAQIRQCIEDKKKGASEDAPEDVTSSSLSAR